MYNTLAAHVNANAATAGLPPAGQSLRACIAARFGGYKTRTGKLDNRGTHQVSNLDETVNVSFCADLSGFFGNFEVSAVTPPKLTARASRWRCPS